MEIQTSIFDAFNGSLLLRRFSRDYAPVVSDSDHETCVIDVIPKAATAVHFIPPVLAGIWHTSPSNLIRPFPLFSGTIKHLHPPYWSNP